MQTLRTLLPRARISVEIEKPGRDDLPELAAQADVVFYSRVWAPGEVVVSVLHEAYPLVRFGTGDVSRWVLGPDGDLRLAGVLGRVGAAVKVRGMFVHPHQAGQVVAALREAGVSAGRFVVERVGEQDILRLEVVPVPGSDPAAIVEAGTRQTRDTLRVRPEVEIVDSLADEAVLVDAREWG